MTSLWSSPIVLDLLRINNHTHRLVEKGIYCSKSNKGGPNTPLSCKFWIENYPMTFLWSKGYCLQNFIVFGRTVFKCIANRQTNKQTFFFIYIDWVIIRRRKNKEYIIILSKEKDSCIHIFQYDTLGNLQFSVWYR